MNWRKVSVLKHWADKTPQEKVFELTGILNDLVKSKSLSLLSFTKFEDLFGAFLRDERHSTKRITEVHEALNNLYKVHDISGEDYVKFMEVVKSFK